jgi:hypothetical protein
MHKQEDGYKMNKTELRAYVLVLIKKITREDMIMEEASEVYNTLLDYTIQVHPEMTKENMDDCIYFAMQASLF